MYDNVSVDKSFAFFCSQIGMPGINTLRLGSPFDFEKQATLVMIKNALPPELKDDLLRPFYGDMLKRYLTETNGGAFVLFTSYQLLKRTASDLMPWLADRKMPLFVQGEGLTRSEMIRQFKQQPNGVLFGTDSFWQGVDVPGSALRNVIITKLPFLVPTNPVVEAKIESIKQRRGNSFQEYQLPTAILKFKQGFGRLIRTRTDTGLVVVLDPRIHSKAYGRQFLAALPKCQIRID
jgi:ATP-dependent DNA helicase DinG